MKPFYIIFNPERGLRAKEGDPSNVIEHSTPEEAQDNAQVLAEKMPGETFHVMQSVGTYKGQVQTRWTKHK